MHLANPHSSFISTIGLAIQAGLLLAAAYIYTRNLWFPIANDHTFIHQINTVNPRIITFGMIRFYAGICRGTFALYLFITQNFKKMKLKVLGLSMLVLLAMSSFAQESEKRFGFELNSGLSVATKKIDGSSLNTGLGFEGLVHYRFMQHLGAYAGWGWNRFGTDESFTSNDFSFEETGYVIGLNFKHPIGSSKLGYYVRGGALYNHIETDDSDGVTIHDSKHGFGFQLAGGLDIDLGRNWSFTPGVKFNSLSRDTKFEGISKNIDYQYISVRIGFAKNF